MTPSGSGTRVRHLLLGVALGAAAALVAFGWTRVRERHAISRTARQERSALSSHAITGEPARAAPLDIRSLAGDPRRESILRGHALLTATSDSLPRYAGNALRCTSCHLDDGVRPHAMPFVGVAARFPQYRSRSGKVDQLEDRVNDCFERSLAGRRLPLADPAMRDIVAYMQWLSRDAAPGGKVRGQGLDSLPLPPTSPHAGRGSAVFAARCASCHGGDGQGTPVAPPLWGPRSYTIGAGMARVRAAAAFIHANMPRGAERTLTAQQAFDVAAYVNSRPRPDFARKADDWPKGNPPPDVAYPTRGTSPPPAP